MGTITISDWLIILATILGPIVAVQVQKAVERFRERRAKKLRVFETLMATRSAKLSADHVKALNMIDIVFHGTQSRVSGGRSKIEQQVLDGWKEYLDHLSTRVEQSEVPAWERTREELFVNLLFNISRDLGFTFDRVQLKKGAYSPIAHGTMETEQEQIRKQLIQVLTGASPLSVNLRAAANGEPEPQAKKPE